MNMSLVSWPRRGCNLCSIYSPLLWRTDRRQEVRVVWNGFSSLFYLLRFVYPAKPFPLLSAVSSSF